MVHHVFESAQERANRELWHDTMVTLMCMASTSELKNTPTGNSAPVWNLLDNAKFHVENDRADGDIETETSTTTNHHTDVDAPAPEVASLAVDTASVPSRLWERPDPLELVRGRNVQALWTTAGVVPDAPNLGSPCMMEYETVFETEMMNDNKVNRLGLFIREASCWDVRVKQHAAK